VNGPERQRDRNGDGSAAEREQLERLIVNLQRHGLNHDDEDVRSAVLTLLQRGSALTLTESQQAELIMDIRRLCHVHDLPEVLSLSGFPVVYNFQQNFDANTAGPWDRYPDSDGVSRSHRWCLMGFEIGYPIGIPASALTVNARYIEYYSRQGFNVITYKTVRSTEWPAHEFPNWIYLKDLSSPLPLSDEPPAGPVIGDPTTFAEHPRSFSTANSFGVPSAPPTMWKNDVAYALERLGEGKLLIVSVMGSSEREDLRDPVRLAEDFVDVACQAESAGAPAVELNLSCPNTIDLTTDLILPAVCLNPDLTELIVARVAETLRPETALVAKLSWMPHKLLETVVARIADRVHCISGINTLPMEVVNYRGEPTFGSRRVAGVSGVAIRNFGLDFVRTLTKLRKRYRWPFEVIAMGGVMNADDVRAYLRAGADAVQTATGAEDNPLLPLELHRERNGELTAITRQVLKALARRPGTDVASLASAASLSPSAVRAGLSELRRRGILREVEPRSDKGDIAMTGIGYEIDERALQQQLR
jgi:dihydroorotate dehydrogenase